MDITILIGNGFDVSLGIKSSYKSFYEWYCPQKSNKKHINEFRKNIDADISGETPDEEKMWSDFEVGIGQYTEKFTKETVNDFLDCFLDAQESIQRYLTSQAQYFNPEKISEDALSSFSNSLWNFYDEVTDVEKSSINNILSTYPNENRRISFITFNYTNTLEKILSRIPDKPLHTWKHNSTSYSYLLNRNIIHVHGTTEVAPILGVNDTTQIKNKELLETSQFKEFLVKAESIQALGYLWQNQAETLISNSRCVCVLGMSFGATDAKWWRKLCQWLAKDSYRRIILYWFEKNPPSKINYVRALQCKNKVKEKILSYSNRSASEQESLKNQIYVVINTAKFMRINEPIANNNTDLQNNSESSKSETFIA